jgi:CSLREA domain-containing protein
MSASALARIALSALLACGFARASSFLVDRTDDTADANPGDGLCLDAEGHCSLRAAIQESNALAGADTIHLQAGIFTLTIAGTGEDASAAGDLDIAGDVALEGAGADATRIDGGAIDRVFDLFGGAAPREVRFERLTVQNGVLVNSGIDSGGAGLRIGVGVHVHLEDVVIRDNHATQSFGGIAIDSRGCVDGERVRILDNRDTAEPGGASAVAAVRVYEDGDTDAGACLALEDSEISGNFADWAGAIEADFAPVTLKRSLVSDNEARFSGAMLLNIQADTLLENVTISGNRGNPGAILNDGGSHLVLVNCTVTANTAAFGTTSVGGIQDVHGGFGLTFLSNTIIFGNGPGFSADDCDRATSVGGGNMIGDGENCHFDAEPSDQIDVDPGLGPLADNGGFTRTHLPGSAAIDRAEAPACPSVDQRGLPRPVDGDGDLVAACDAGALEVQREAIFASGFDA